MIVVAPTSSLPGLSILMPVYNEIASISAILERVRVALPGVTKEIVIVDDGSRDGTRAWLSEEFSSVADETSTVALQKARAGAGVYVAELDPEAMNGTNNLRLFVFGNDAVRQVRLVALLDNLGKGAAGAAVQNLNLALGLEEAAGL